MRVECNYCGYMVQYYDLIRAKQLNVYNLTVLYFCDHPLIQNLCSIRRTLNGALAEWRVGDKLSM